MGIALGGNYSKNTGTAPTAWHLSDDVLPTRSAKLPVVVIMRQSPLSIVKDRFKDKGKLVDAVEKLMTDELGSDRLNVDKGLARVSNRKLLHLHDVLTRLKADFGSRAKLIDAIAADLGRPRDGDYKASLERFGSPKLMELYRAAHKRAAAKAS